MLVPLVAKGYLRRANTLPYIAGANITTLADTLVAAILLGTRGRAGGRGRDAHGHLWTLIVLQFVYPPVRRACLGVARFALRSPAHLAGFVGGLLAVPIMLIAI